jgi:iron complex outermembrane receptor protein
VTGHRTDGSIRRWACRLALLPLVAATTLHGASPPGEEGSARPDLRDEITVTARQREVDLHEAPVAVSVVSGEDFARSHTGKLDHLSGYVPGLLVTRNDGAGRVVSIRGVGWETAQNLSTQPSVLLYLDGIYVANPLAFGLELGEIERIEVFRGPQGTEFGQGTTGGAINVVTRKPDFARRFGDVALSAGTHGTLEASGSVNLPLGDALALRLSAREARHDGFSRIQGGPLDGFELDDADALAAHLALEWVPHPSLSLRLSGFLNDSDQHGAAQRHVADPNPDPRRVTQDFASTFALDNESYALVADWDTPWGFRLRSLTGFQRLRKRQTADGDRLTEELVAVDLTGFGPANFDLLPFWDNDSRALSQEWVATGDGDRLSWTLGLYYLEHENTNFFLEAIGPGPAAQFADALENPSPESLPPFEVPLEFVEDRTLTRRDAAAFAQAAYRLSRRWAVTVGGRYQRDRATDITTQFWVIDSRQRLSDSALTWKAGVDLRLDDDHLLYFLASTGWKNGGNNPGALDSGALDVPIQFAPEEVRSLELGSRSRWAQGRVRLHLTAFLYDYDNYQFLQEDPIPFAAGTGNIPEVRLSGLESELSWQLDERWSLDGQVTLLDGEIESELFTLDVVDFLHSGFGRFTTTAVGDRASLRVNLRGNEPPKLADLTARWLLSHERELAGGALLTARLDFLYRGAYESRVFNHPQADRVPPYSTLGLALGYRPAGRPWEVTLRAANLQDTAGVNSRFTNPFGLHTTSEELIPPRQVIASVRYRF